MASERPPSRSTTALSLAQQGVKTLLVDVDPQGGIGLPLTGDSRAKGLKGYLAGERLEDCILKTRVPDFSILPVGAIRGLERAQMSSRLEDGMRLQLLVDTCRDVDCVVFDTPAGLLGSTIGALRASDFAVSPVQAEPLAAASLPQLLELIGDLRDEGARVVLKGVVLTMVQREDETSMNVLDLVWNKLPASLVMDAHIPRDPAFLAASEAGVPLAFLSRRPPPIARRFDELASEIAQLIPMEEVDNEPISLLL